MDNKLSKLPHELFLNILDFIGFLNIKTISRLGSTCNVLQKESRMNDVWIKYYNSLFPKKRILTKTSKHRGPQTYHLCKIGKYRGWKFIHKEIHPNVCVCNKMWHYTNTIPRIKGEDIIEGLLFLECSKRKLKLEEKKKRKCNCISHRDASAHKDVKLNYIINKFRRVSLNTL